jgi:alcohol dehydrogenase class IV
MANVFLVPRYIVSGENALKTSMDEIKTYGKKAMIVTDKNMIDLGYIKKLTDELSLINIAHFIYSDINSEPNHTMIDKGVELYKNEKCDFLIALGGGSPIDAMKAIAAVHANGGSICDYVGKALQNDLPRMVAVPTTAGTGSEVTKNSISANADTNVKMLIANPKLIVDCAGLEYEFTITQPQSVTAATGIDALTHALEAYTSVKANVMSELFAVSAIKRIFANLYEAFKNGSNKDARREMSLAAFEAGVSFGNASVTIVHGMSRPIGALFHVPHGMSNAMLLKVCLNFLKTGVVDRLCELSKAIGVYKPGMTTEEGSEAFVAATNELLRLMQIKTPMDYGIKKEDFFKYIPKMSEDGMASGSPQNTRRTPTKEDLVELYTQFWNESAQNAK